MAMQFVLTAWATEPGQSACGALGASPSDNLPAAPTAPTQKCVNPVLRPPETRQSLMGCLSKECMWGRSISWFHRERWFSSSVRFSSTSIAKDGEAFAVHLQPLPLLRQLLQWAFNSPWWCRVTFHTTHLPRTQCHRPFSQVTRWQFLRLIKPLHRPRRLPCPPALQSLPHRLPVLFPSDSLRLELTRCSQSQIRHLTWSWLAGETLMKLSIELAQWMQVFQPSPQRA